MLPITIRLTRAQVEDLACSEEGRHEDSAAARARGEDGEDAETCHAYLVASRAPGAVLVVNTPEEASDLYYAVCSGTFQIHNYPAAVRIADRLRDVVREHDPEILRLWRAPYGP